MHGSFLLHCQCALSDPASPARLTLDVTVERVGIAVASGGRLLTHASSCGMSCLVAPAQSCVRPRRHSSRLCLSSLNYIATCAVSAQRKFDVPLRVGYLLTPPSFARLHTLFEWSLVLFPQIYSSLHLLRVDGTRLLWRSVCLFSRARHWCRNPACCTHVVKPCFQGLQADVCTSLPRSCSVTPPCRKCTLAGQANLLTAGSHHDGLAHAYVSLVGVFALHWWAAADLDAVLAISGPSGACCSS